MDTPREAGLRVIFPMERSTGWRTDVFSQQTARMRDPPVAMPASLEPVLMSWGCHQSTHRLGADTAVVFFLMGLGAGCPRCGISQAGFSRGLSPWPAGVCLLAKPSCGLSLGAHVLRVSPVMRALVVFRVLLLRPHLPVITS